MAPISTTLLTAQASQAASAASTAAAEDSVALQSEIRNYPLIGAALALWTVICVIAICVWLGRARHNGAGTHWIPEDDKCSLRKRTVWRKRRSSDKYHGESHQSSLPPLAPNAFLGLGLPIASEKVPTITVTPASVVSPPRMPKPTRSRTTSGSGPRLVQFSPHTPTILSAPLATPIVPTFGNVSVGGTPFWAPAWALQAAEARATLKAAQLAAQIGQARDRATAARELRAVGQTLSPRNIAVQRLSRRMRYRSLAARRAASDSQARTALCTHPTFAPLGQRFNQNSISGERLP